MITFKGRHTPKPVILQCLRGYCSYALSYRHIEEMMAERGLIIDHSTLNRWVIHYAAKMERPSRSRKYGQVINGEWIGSAFQSSAGEAHHSLNAGLQKLSHSSMYSGGN